MAGHRQTAQDFFRDQTILVTGGVGSVGRHLVKRLLSFEPSSIRVLDNNETGLFNLEHEVKTPLIRTLVGDVRDRDRLNMAMYGVDTVFHAAALKHVPLCEFNPFDAVKTNVLGTQNIIEAAIANDVRCVMNISTDKAVIPTNVMGATKLLGERLISSAAYYTGKRKTIFSSVRFGNVLNTRGSVIPLFHSQIQQGGPVTVTDPDMTRFFMDIPQAVDLILRATVLARGRELFILKMPALRLGDLAECMIETYAPHYGFAPERIAVQTIGRRSGEKLHEDLMMEDEAPFAYESRDMFVIFPHIYYSDGYRPRIPRGFQKSGITSFSSQNARLISKDGIRRLLRMLGEMTPHPVHEDL
jgi:FlaA1/EpsC-like NDP-sugar epimerase